MESLIDFGNKNQNNSQHNNVLEEYNLFEKRKL